MDGYQRRHQQAVGSRRHPEILAVALCLLVTLGAFFWGASHTEGSRGRRSAEVSGEVDGGSAALESDASTSGAYASRGDFLQNLEEGATLSEEGTQGAVSARYTWDEDRSLVEVGEDILLSYQQMPTTQLAMSGYLDIKGNVWCAIVRDARGWVDMVTCSATQDDAACRTTVVRLAPDDDKETEGP